MPRELVLGNHNLLVGIDNRYNIRDIYYPHVGMVSSKKKIIWFVDFAVIGT